MLLVILQCFPIVPFYSNLILTFDCFQFSEILAVLEPGFDYLYFDPYIYFYLNPQLLAKVSFVQLIGLIHTPFASNTFLS